jgi:hypothetical protein
MAFLLVWQASMPVRGQDIISLEGTWKFRLDPDGEGIPSRWYEQVLPDAVRLPGSLDEQGIGKPHGEINLGRLTPETSYQGMAWYQREVVIPGEWQERRIELFLERVCWESTVYVDGIPAGSCNSLSVPHRYELGELLTPGRHRLTLCVDNTVKINIGHTHGDMLWCHALSAETQTNWNGIIGEIKLQAHPPVSLGRISVHPDFRDRVARVLTAIRNHSGETAKGQVQLRWQAGGPARRVEFSLEGRDTLLQAGIPFAEGARSWDEFSPALHTLEISLQAGEHADQRKISLGLREFGTDGHHFVLNGRRILLRGKVCSAVFPLTGYPPMTVAAWERMFGIYREYGLNHVRFHSWCPPEAAFLAADRLGLILQVEPPLWDGYGLVGSLPKRAAYILEEAGRMIDTYGNHPSFCLMSLGNELGDGKDPYLAYLLDYLQQKDPRHLYTSTTHPAGTERADDYFVAAGTDAGICRGAKPFGNFREALVGLKRPLIAHELGQPAMYPDFSQTGKYTGHLKPRYLEVFRDSLAAHHMLDQAEDFRRASGAFLVELYKENIEAQLRTPNVAGFQLLDIQDYPGHGMATIGILDVFLDSKGLISPEGFRKFCGPTVPLIRMQGFTFRNDEIIRIEAEMAHFGKADLRDQQVNWLVRVPDGKVLDSGVLGPVDIVTGGSTPLGFFESDPSRWPVPLQLEVVLSLPGTGIENAWKCWVYPAEPAMAIPPGITVADAWNEAAREVLREGGRVLLMPGPGSLENAEMARWEPVFWSYQLFKQPRMMGLLCDPEHPVFEYFPTAYHTDWQWRDLLDRSEALRIDRTPAGFRPLVQFIPDFNSQQRLSALLEANVGRGRLMVCNMDLLNKRSGSPVAEQFLRSLLAYMQSEGFQPVKSLEMELLDVLLKASEPLRHQAEKPPAERAVLNVRAAEKSPVGQPDPWEKEKDYDGILSQQEGFGYSVEGRYWRDASHSIWFGNHLVIKVSCPPDFRGSLYVHMHDIDNSGRGAALFFGGRDQGPIHRYDGEGVWLRFRVDRELAASGELVFDARGTMGPNVTIAQFILIPEEN